MDNSSRYFHRQGHWLNRLDIEASAQDRRIDMEEVGRHDALGLGSEELRPRGSCSARGWWQSVVAQHVGDAALGHGDTDLFALTDDAQVAPPGILSGEAYDQLDGLLGQGWPARPAVGIGPTAADEGPMPAKDRLGGDEERCPPLAWHQPRQRRDERPVGPGESGTGAPLRVRIE